MTGKYEERRTKTFYIRPNTANKYENVNGETKEKNSNQAINENNNKATEDNRPLPMIDLTLSDPYIHLKDLK